MLISPSQLKAARNLLGWSPEHLANEAALSKKALILFESGAKSLAIVHLQVCRETLENAGVRFSADGEVVLRAAAQSLRAMRRS
jgi:DNA-binding XRE family transcriptional regulator